MKLDKNHTKEEILKEIEDLAKPIDFEDLINRGILEKKGNRYKIKLINDLPVHVRNKIISMDSRSSQIPQKLKIY